MGTEIGTQVPSPSGEYSNLLVKSFVHISLNNFLNKGKVTR